MEWFGLGGPQSLQDLQFQPPAMGQGHLPLPQVPPSPVQADLGHTQGWERFKTEQ